MKWLTETLIDDTNNITYEFESGFDYSRKFNELKRNYQEDYSKICNGDPCVDVFFAVLTSSIARVNGEEINEHEKDEVVKLIISRFGNQACSYVCHKIMFETYVGEIEAKKSHHREQWKEIQKVSSLSSRGIFSRAGLLWVTTAMIFGAVGCVILNGLQMLT